MCSLAGTAWHRPPRRCPARLGQPRIPRANAYDFGIVARGSQVRHAFPVVNRTDMEVRIVDWKTKCGCTDVRVGVQGDSSGHPDDVEATIDTTRFHGHKASGLTLVLDRPVSTELDLNMNCFIRADITLTPGWSISASSGLSEAGPPCAS